MKLAESIGNPSFFGNVKRKPLPGADLLAFVSVFGSFGLERVERPLSRLRREVPPGRTYLWLRRRYGR